MKFLLLLLVLTSTTLLYSQPDVNVFQDRKARSYEFYADNLEDFPVSISFDFELINLKVVPEGFSEIIVPARAERFKLLELEIVNIFKSYDYKYVETIEKVDASVESIIALAPEVVPKEVEDNTITNTTEEIEKTPKVNKFLEISEPEIAVEVETEQTTEVEINTAKPVIEVEAPVEVEPRVSVKPLQNTMEPSKPANQPIVMPTPVSEVIKNEPEIAIIVPEKSSELTHVEENTLKVNPTVIGEEPKEVVVVQTIEELSTEAVVIPQKELEETIEPEVIEITEVEVPEEVFEIPVEQTPTEIQPPKEEEEKPLPDFDTSMNFSAAHAYNLPFKRGGNYYISQGYFTEKSHKDKFAIDFAMPEGTAVHAAREGMVVEVVQSHLNGCNIKSCEHSDNYVIVQHPDGSFAKYGHLKQNSATVSRGDLIALGQMLAYSGSTGWSSIPSLHFEVYQITDEGIKTYRTNFRVGDGTNYNVLLEPQYYSRDYD